MGISDQNRQPACERTECCCRHKATPRDEKELRQLQNRLKRMMGQLGGISKMLEENRYCGDILVQVAAVESAPAADFTSGPSALRHPYSQALWRALPQNGFAPIPGFQPYAGNLPKGCLFAPRCQYATDLCRKSEPELMQMGGRKVRCHRYTPEWGKSE